MNLVSIVVPVYQTESYLDACVTSLVSQTFTNIEVILVEDGSPDASAKKCDLWAERDSRVKVIHQENQGVTKARANGVLNARGDWILFVDSDDTIPFCAVEKMVCAVGSNDILVGQINFKGPYVWPYEKKSRELNGNQYVKALLRRHKIHSGPVAKLFKRSLFNEFIFDIPDTVKCGEDFIMNLRLASNAKKIKIVETIVYDYFFREGSAVTKNPFESLSFVMLFDLLIVKSIRITSVGVLWWLLMDFLNRMFVWFKQNLKKIVL